MLIVVALIAVMVFFFRALDGSSSDPRVGSGSFRNLMGRVGAGRACRFEDSQGSRVGPPLLDPTRPAPCGF